MTDKNKSLNLLIERERNEANEQLLIENKDLKQRISTLLAYISSLEYKLNNLYHKEEKEAKNTVKLSPEEYEGFEEGFKKMIEAKSKRKLPFELTVFEEEDYDSHLNKNKNK